MPAIAIAACLAGCAQTPVAPERPAPAAAPAPAPRRVEDSNAPALAARAQRAAQLRAAGDLARAEAELHVLTLLAPESAQWRQQHDEVRAEIAKVRDEQLRIGNNALRGGDGARATDAFLRVLAVDPDNHEAAQALREMDRRKIARIASDRVAKASQAEAAAPAPRSNARQAPANDQSAYQLEQGMELFNAGDTTGGLRELRAYVDAHPKERDARVRIGNAVYDRGRELEGRNEREQAANLYEAAVALRGDTPPAWNGRIVTLRKGLSNDYYDRGTRAMRTDLPGAIKLLETSVRYDPGNTRAVARLSEARTLQQRLNAIGAGAH